MSAKAQVANPYAWHDAAMRGVRRPISADEPMTGWYRNRRKDKQTGVVTWTAVAYWKDTTTGEQRCHIDGKAPTENRMFETWPYASKYPISEETYDAYLATGKWPEHNDVLAEQERRSNEAPDDDSLEGVRARIDALVGEANRLMKKGAAKTKAEADAAADVAVRLGELTTHGNKIRLKQTEPLRTEVEGINLEWKRVLDPAAIYTRLKAMVVQPWLNAENRRLEDEANAAEAARQKIIQDARDKAAAERAARDAEYAEQAEQAVANQTPLPPAPEEVEVKLPDAAYEPTPKFVPVRAGTGKTVSARAVKTMQIEDYAKALAFFAEHPEVKALVQSLADKQAKLDMPVPGCRQLTDGKAV